MSQEEVCRSVIYLVDYSFSSAQTFSQPTLNPDSSGRRDIVYFDRFSIKFWGSCDKEDVVALRHVQRVPQAEQVLTKQSRSPTNPKQLLVKRIIALAGDTVKTLPPYPDAEITIPPGHVWVEG